MITLQNYFTYALPPCDYVVDLNGKCIPFGPMGYTGCKTGKDPIPDTLAYILRMINIDEEIFYKTVNYLIKYVGEPGYVSYPDKKVFRGEVIKLEEVINGEITMDNLTNYS